MLIESNYNSTVKPKKQRNFNESSGNKNDKVFTM